MNETDPKPACCALGELFRMFAPPEEVQQHFKQARLEVLKGVRAMIDQRIQDLSQSAARGTKVTVE